MPEEKHACFINVGQRHRDILEKIYSIRREALTAFPVKEKFLQLWISHTQLYWINITIPTQSSSCSCSRRSSCAAGLCLFGSSHIVLDMLGMCLSPKWLHVERQNLLEVLVALDSSRQKWDLFSADPPNTQTNSLKSWPWDKYHERIFWFFFLNHSLAIPTDKKSGLRAMPKVWFLRHNFSL